MAINCDALQVYEGLESPDRRRDAPRSGRGSSTGCSASSRSPRTSRSATTCRSPTARSTRRWRRGGGRSSSAAPASTCGRRSPSSRCVKVPPESEDSELWSPETRHPTTIFGLDMDRDAALRADRRPHRGDRRRRRRRGGCAAPTPLGPGAHRPQGARLRRAARRRRRGDEEALAQLRPPPAHLDAEDPQPPRDRQNWSRRCRGLAPILSSLGSIE